MRADVVRLFLQHPVIDAERLLRFIVHHEHVAIHPQVVQVVRIALGQSLHLGQRRFLVAHARVHLALGIRQALALAVDVFQPVQYADGLFVVLLLVVELEQQLQQVLAVLMLLVELLRDGDSLFEFLLADVGLSQCFQVDGVVGAQFCGALGHLQRFVRVLQQDVVLRQEVIGLRCFGVYLDAVA